MESTLNKLQARFQALCSGLLALALLLSACGPAQPGPEATPTLDQGAVFTAVVATQTEAAQLTALAGLSNPPASIPSPMPITGPTATRLSASAGGTPNPTGTATGAPTPTGLPYSTRGDKASYVSDLTIPDGTRLEPGEGFTKSWRLLNSGDTTWSTEYDLVFVSGSHMGGPASVPVPVEVEPGKTVDLSVDLTAPTASGSYRGFWMLRNHHGEYFGIGAQADQAVWVDILIGPGEGTPGQIITSIQAGAEVSTGRGGCPAFYNLYLYVTVTRPATIKYQWEGHSEMLGGRMSDFAVREAEITEAGSFSVGPEPFTVGATAYGQLRVHILEPENLISAPLDFGADCDTE